jgi:hypothetical protein
LTGASFTALTVMLTVSVSLCAPPEPVLPWSSVTIWTTPRRCSWRSGVKLSPSGRR